jgi:hypothetical protein
VPAARAVHGHALTQTAPEHPLSGLCSMKLCLVPAAGCGVAMQPAGPGQGFEDLKISRASTQRCKEAAQAEDREYQTWGTQQAIAQGNVRVQLAVKPQCKAPSIPVQPVNPVSVACTHMQAIISMPTGSGKTRIAVRFLQHYQSEASMACCSCNAVICNPALPTPLCRLPGMTRWQSSSLQQSPSACRLATALLTLQHVAATSYLLSALLGLHSKQTC